VSSREDELLQRWPDWLPDPLGRPEPESGTRARADGPRYDQEPDHVLEQERRELSVRYGLPSPLLMSRRFACWCSDDRCWCGLGLH
jgi:hypothetical protein